jgi:Surfeit locus protein 5 subunit 22 of Mediator complex
MLGVIDPSRISEHRYCSSMFAPEFSHVFFFLKLIAGGGHMMSSQDPPPPPLAADVALSTLQCQLAVENICVATSNVLSLIRTLRLSLLLMDEDTMNAEEQVEVERTQKLTQQAMQTMAELEQRYMDLQNKVLE